MDHVVYLDAAAKELDRILGGEKTMIIRGATGRKMPYGRVNVGDTLFFLNNDAEGLIRAKAEVSSVLNSDAMTEEESLRLVEEHQGELQLTPKQLSRWGGKRYLVLIGIEKVAPLSPFGVDKSDYGNMDDWLMVGEIGKVKLIK